MQMMSRPFKGEMENMVTGSWSGLWMPEKILELWMPDSVNDQTSSYV